ncbi:MAG: sigma-70 family RNA polymerase sigma factor [Acidobacteria bacterium]|nr:sigma-70 family RNA polymerase sigma factor [Acidobacteriota bacterium]
MPDNNDSVPWQLFVENSRATIGKAVQLACRKYKHYPTPDEIEDFTAQIIVQLLDNDCQKLRTYDSRKAAFKTWLQTLINHHISRQLQRKHAAEPLEEYFLMLSYAPKQENELLWKERRVILEAAIKTLSLHDQGIAYLKLREVSNEEIAQELNIKAASVGREWRVIKNKLRQIMTDAASPRIDSMIFLFLFC